ncbi:hypothetical protein Hte_006260 [Hypoxylon texense]
MQWLGQQDNSLSAANLHAAYLGPSSMTVKKREEHASDGQVSPIIRTYADLQRHYLHMQAVSLAVRIYEDLQRHYRHAQASLEQEVSKNTAATLWKEFDAAVGEGTIADATVRAEGRGGDVIF